MRSACLSILLGMAWAISPSVWALEPDQLFDKLSPSVWTVSNYDARARVHAMGSAVVIGPGRLITNCHVVEKGSSFSVRRENVAYGATVEWADPERDLCQLKVAGFDAPAVQMGDMATLKVGARVYAIGSPRGFEMTLSDGLISALRRDDDGKLVYIQTSAPISPGSSGGGLFDQEGRLIGVTTLGGKDAQNLNFAVPSALIAEVPLRAQARAARRETPSVTSSTSAELGSTRRVGDWFEYRVTDALTGVGRTISLTVERVLGERVVFNGGSRIEDATGQLMESKGGVLGEMDALTPPGGWARVQQQPGATWPVTFTGLSSTGAPIEFDLKASVTGEQSIRLSGRSYRVIAIELSGWNVRLGSLTGLRGSPTPYRASVGYAPELSRPVRFSVEVRDSPRQLIIKETIELVDAGGR